VARDRQRAKQRRRQRQSGAPADGARAAGLDDSTVEDAGLGDGTPAPDPLKHASAEVDQAHLAEAGADRGLSGDAEHREHEDDPGYGVQYTPAADEVEGDQPVRRGELDPAVQEETVAPPTKSGPRFIAFLGHCIDELRRVRWPDRRQVGQATAVVLGFVVIAGGYLGLMDAIFKPLVQAIL
jgi:preprotein translocase SecE subunit